MAGVGGRGGLADGVVRRLLGQGASAPGEVVVAVVLEADLLGERGDGAARRERAPGQVGVGHEADQEVFLGVCAAGQVDGVADGRSPIAARISFQCSST